MADCIRKVDDNLRNVNLNEIERAALHGNVVDPRSLNFQQGYFQVDGNSCFKPKRASFGSLWMVSFHSELSSGVCCGQSKLKREAYWIRRQVIIIAQVVGECGAFKLLAYFPAEHNCSRQTLLAGYKLTALVRLDPKPHHEVRRKLDPKQKGGPFLR